MTHSKVNGISANCLLCDFCVAWSVTGSDSLLFHASYYLPSACLLPEKFGCSVVAAFLKSECGSPVSEKPLIC